MTRKIDPKFYEGLSPEERFLAAFAAKARGDEVELDRLKASCPQKQYVQSDDQFVTRCEAANVVGVLFAMDLEPAVLRLRMADAFDLLICACAGMASVDAWNSYGAGYEAGVEFAGAGAIDWEGPQGDEFGEQLGATCEAAQGRILKRFDDPGDRQRVAVEISSMISAFGEVCRETIGLEPEQVLAASWAALRPCLDTLQTASELVEGIEPEPEQARSYALLLSRIWQGTLAKAV